MTEATNNRRQTDDVRQRCVGKFSLRLLVKKRESIGCVIPANCDRSARNTTRSQPSSIRMRETRCTCTDVRRSPMSKQRIMYRPIDDRATPTRSSTHGRRPAAEAAYAEHETWRALHRYAIRPGRRSHRMHDLCRAARGELSRS